MRTNIRAVLVAEYLFAGAVGLGALVLLNAPPVAYGAWAALIIGPFVATVLFSRGDGGGASDAYVRLIIPLVSAALVLGLYHVAHQTDALIPFIGRDLDEFEQYVGEQYYAVISTLFAIITALILVKGIESFDRLNTVIGEEANQVRSIVEFLYYFEEQEHTQAKSVDMVLAQTTAIRRHLGAYCEDALSDPASSRAHGAYHILRETTQVVGAIECKDDNDRMALSEVMRGLNLLFSIRARRVSCSRAKVPVYIIVTLGFMSLAIVAPFFIGSPVLHPINPAIIGVLTIFCTFVLMLLRDINSPFEGFWRVDLRPMADLREELRAVSAQPTLKQTQAARAGLSR